jgi:hypothetical protein
MGSGVGSSKGPDADCTIAGWDCWGVEAQPPKTSANKMKSQAVYFELAIFLPSGVHRICIISAKFRRRFNPLSRMYGLRFEELSQR